MKKWSVVVCWSCGYYGSKQYVVEAETKLEAKRIGIQQTQQYILDSSTIPNWVAKTSTMTADAGEYSY